MEALSRHGSSATSSAASPGSARTWTTSPIRSGERDLRSFGSQGEQRLAVLSLLLAEAEVIAEQRGTPPLVLLDDVLSELDASRRRILAERIGRVGQAIVTATGADALPLEPAQLLEVTPGAVSSRLMERLGRRGAPRARPLRADRGRHRRDRARLAARRRGDGGSERVAGEDLRGTGRCSCTRPRRPGRSSSAASPGRSSRSSATELGKAAPRALKFAAGPLPDAARRGLRGTPRGRSREHSGAARGGGRDRRRNRGRRTARAGRESGRGEPRERGPHTP